MKRFNKILVCVASPVIGGQKIRYTSAIIRLAESSELRLLHVVDPDEASAPPPMTLEDLGRLETEILDEHPNLEVIRKVVTGSVLIEILRSIHDNDVDLVVIGGAGGDPGHEGYLARQITRKSSCTVLVLPTTAEVKAGRILVPVRDTECSEIALETACSIAQRTEAEVIALNIFQVHSGPGRAGTPMADHIKKIETIAAHENESLLGRVDTGDVPVDHLLLPDLYNRPAPIILEAAKAESADLIIIGARGRTGAAGVLLGDTTEQLIKSTPVPLLAVKKKGETLGVLGALLTIAKQGE